MVKISELSNGAGIGGTEQVPVNDSGTTVKYTVDQMLARQHNHTASQVTDFNTAVDARIDVLTDTAKTTPVDTDVFALWDTVRKKVTRANIKATLKTYFDTLYHTKNALRTGLTASQILTTDGGGNEGYTALSLLPVVASDAEALAGTDQTRYINSLQLKANTKTSSGTTSIATSNSTGTQNIAHGLGVAPRLVEFSYVQLASVTGNGMGKGTYDGTTNRSLGIRDGGAHAEYRISSTNCIERLDASSVGWSATATVDATNIVLSRSKSGAGNNIGVLRIAHA